jgi:3-methyladenine DNA glycosylase/8-oxoguanine DNA glycosylase
MADHTKLPWHHSRKSVYVSDINHTCIAQMLREQDVNEANAAFIVKAVNNHERMVAELKRLFDLYGHQATKDVLDAMGGPGK